MTPRRCRLRQAGLIAGWVSLGLLDVAALVKIMPWMPIHLHGLAVGGMISATVLYAWARFQAPVRASFIDGMLHERESGASRGLPDMPIAAGDGIASVTSIVRPGPSGGKHRNAPAPRPRSR